MYLRIGREHEAALQRHGVQFVNFGGQLYVAIAELKGKGASLSDELDIARLVRFDTLVFTADFEVLREVGSTVTRALG